MFASQSTLEVDGTIYENNFALRNGAIYVISSKLNIKNCTFYKNKASNGQGGAVSVLKGDALSMLLTKFVSNVAKEGSAVYTSRVNVVLEDCMFSENNALASGACVFLDHSSIHAERVTFHENQAHLESGGAIDVKSNSKLHAFNMTIRGKVNRCNPHSILHNDFFHMLTFYRKQR